MPISRRAFLTAASAVTLLGTAAALPSPAPSAPSVAVLGLGGAGISATNRLLPMLRGPVEVVAADADLPTLRASLAADRLLVRGEAELPLLLPRLAGHSILVGGLGGGFATSALSTLSRRAPSAAAVVTTPFWFEGRARRRVAHVALASLAESAQLLVPVALQDLLLTSGRVPLQGAVHRADQVVAHVVDAVRVALVLHARGVLPSVAGLASPSVAQGSDPVEAVRAAAAQQDQAFATARSVLVHLRGSAPSPADAHDLEAFVRSRCGLDPLLSHSHGEGSDTASVLVLKAA